MTSPPSDQALAGGSQAQQHRRERETGSEFIGMGPKARNNLQQANRISPEHRSAGGSRPAIAVEPDDIDVGGALRDALFKDPRALVDHGIKQPLQDLLILDPAWPIAPLLGEPSDDRFDFRGRRSNPLCIVVVVPLRRFLAAPIALAKQIANALPLEVSRRQPRSRPARSLI